MTGIRKSEQPNEVPNKNLPTGVVRRNLHWLLNAAAVAIVCTLVGAGYYLGRDMGQKDLDNYKLAQQIDFGTLTTSANSATSNLKQAVSQFERATSQFEGILASNKSYKEMSERVDLATKRIEELEEKLKATSANLASTSEELKKTKSDLVRAQKQDQYVTLKQGQAAEFGKDLIIGVTSQNYDWAYLNVNGDKIDVSAGSIKSVKDFQGHACQIRVLSLDSKEGTTLAANCSD